MWLNGRPCDMCVCEREEFKWKIYRNDRNYTYDQLNGGRLTTT